MQKSRPRGHVCCEGYSECTAPIALTCTLFAGFASHARLPLAVSLPLAVRLRSRLDGGGQRPERALGVAVEELPFVE